MSIDEWAPLSVSTAAVVISSLFAAACVDTPMTPRETTVQITVQGLVELRADLRPPTECMTRAVVTRVYPSWQGFTGVAMVALPPDVWQVTFQDVPIGQAVRFRINDKNWCDRNSTGAVLGDVSANGVQLVQNATTPGPNGEEPGFSFVVEADGQVRQ